MWFNLAVGVCVSSCGADLVLPSSYAPVPTEEVPCPVPQKKSCCMKRFAFTLCDADSLPTSLSDPEAIALLKTNNKLISFPKASVQFEDPTDEIFEYPCGEKEVISTTQLINISVYTVAEDHSDETFWKDMCALSGKLGFIGQWEDNYTVLADDWIQAAIDEDAVLPVTQMGVPFSFTKKPRMAPFTKGQPCRWDMQIEVNIECVLRSAYMTGFIGQLET